MMNSAIPSRSVAAAEPANTTRTGRLVTDAPTRMFHWLFAASFLGAYLTSEGERWRALHVTLGYTLAGLLAFRVLYGLFGPRHAAIVPMFRKLSAAPAWLRSLGQAARTRRIGTVPWRQGQNLAIAAVIASLLLLAAPLTLSGYATFHEWGGTLAQDALAEVHEWLGNTFLAVVLAHLALIVGLSLWRRKNQALPMLTGRIDGAGPDLVQQPHGWLAAWLLTTVLAFVAWEWQQSPSGLVPTGPSTSASRPDTDHD